VYIKKYVVHLHYNIKVKLMRKFLLILSVLSLTVTSCKNENDNQGIENKEITEKTSIQKLTEFVEKEETPSLEEYNSTIYPLILEVGKEQDWTLIMHVAKKAHDAPDEDIFKANYNDLSVLLNKNLNNLK